jgi:UTP:GlnB (protein PII) uridylyltransferase
MLFLEVRGEDCVGFLGSLLEGLADAALSAEEMRVETQGNIAFDQFQLRGHSGQMPSAAMHSALSRWLESITLPRARRLDA